MVERLEAAKVAHLGKADGGKTKWEIHQIYWLRISVAFGHIPVKA